jgi:hypothetical protein
MTVAVPAIVKVPPIYTDADFSFDFVFFDFDLNTPHNFAAGDVASLVLVCRDQSISKVEYLSSDPASPLSFSALNAISLQIPKVDTQSIFPTNYAFELRRLGIDGSIEVLAIGAWPVQVGLSLDSTMQSPATWARNCGISSGANVIFTDAQAQIVYTGFSLSPVTAVFPDMFYVASDGSDDTPSFVAAVAYAATNGIGIVSLKRRDYNIATANQIALSNIKIVGTGIYPGGPNAATDLGSRILITNQAASPFAPGSDCTFDGVTFYWPNQTSAGPVIAYPALFMNDNAIRFVLENCTVFNAYRIIQINDGGSPQSGGWRIENCNLWAIDAGIYLLKGTATVCFIKGIWFSPAVAASINNVTPFALTLQASVSGAFLRYDIAGSSRPKIAGLEISDVVCFGSRYGIHAVSGSIGVSRVNMEVDGTGSFITVESLADVDGVTFDSPICYCYQYDPTGSGPYGATGKAHAFEVFTGNTISSNLININNPKIFYSQGDGIHIEGVVTNLNVSGGIIKSWGHTQDNTVTEARAIYLNNANVDGIVDGVTFLGDTGIDAGIVVDSCSALSVVANHFDGCHKKNVWTRSSAANVRVRSNRSTNTAGAVLQNDTGVASTLIAVGNDWDKDVAPSCFPQFAAKPTAGQVFGAGISTIAFTSTTFDGTGSFNQSTGVYIAPIRGSYRIRMTLGFVSGTAGDEWVLILTTSDGQVFKTETFVPPSGGPGQLVIDTLVKLAPTVTIVCTIQRGSGSGSLTLQNTQYLQFEGAVVNS